MLIITESKQSADLRARIRSEYVSSSEGLYCNCGQWLNCKFQGELAVCDHLVLPEQENPHIQRGILHHYQETYYKM